MGVPSISLSVGIQRTALQEKIAYTVVHVSYTKSNDETLLESRVIIKAAYSVTMNIFLKKCIFSFKSFTKVELSYVVTINLISTAENCMEK